MSVRPRAARAGRRAVRRAAPWAVSLAATALIVAVFRLFDTVHGIDLRVYYEAGRDVLNGGLLYDGPRGAARVPLTYPPFAAVAAVVLAVVPWNALQWIWATVNVLALLIVVRLGYRAWLGRRRHSRAWAIGLTALWCASVPVSDHLGYGQVGLVLMAACISDADPHVRLPRWLPRGVLTGVAGAVRLLPVAYLLLPFASRRWRTVAWGAGAFAVCGLVSLAIVPGAVRTFVTDVLPGLSGRVAVGDPSVHGDQSLRAAVLRALPADAPAWAVDGTWAVLSAAVLAGAGAAAVRAMRLRGRTAALVVVALGVQLATPVAWTHHFVWLIPAVGLLVGGVPGRGVARSSRMLAALVTAAAFARTAALVARFPPPVPVLDQLATDAVTVAAVVAIIGLAGPFDVRFPPATRAGALWARNFPTARSAPGRTLGIRAERPARDAVGRANP